MPNFILQSDNAARLPLPGPGAGDLPRSAGGGFGRFLAAGVTKVTAVPLASEGVSGQVVTVPMHDPEAGNQEVSELSDLSNPAAISPAFGPDIQASPAATLPDHSVPAYPVRPGSDREAATRSNFLRDVPGRLHPDGAAPETEDVASSPDPAGTDASVSAPVFAEPAASPLPATGFAPSDMPVPTDRGASIVSVKVVAPDPVMQPVAALSLSRARTDIGRNTCSLVSAQVASDPAVDTFARDGWSVTGTRPDPGAVAGHISRAVFPDVTVLPRTGGASQGKGQTGPAVQTAPGAVVVSLPGHGPVQLNPVPADIFASSDPTDAVVVTALAPQAAPGSGSVASSLGSGHMPPATAQIAQGVAQSLAQGLTQARGDRFEIVLSPEELGRVRIHMHPMESGLQVSIVTERPETLEFLRKNIGQLARDLSGLGFEGMSFSFSQDTRSGQDHRAETLPDLPVALRTTVAATRGGTTPHMAGGGLDLRF